MDYMRQWNWLLLIVGGGRHYFSSDAFDRVSRRWGAIDVSGIIDHLPILDRTRLPTILFKFHSDRLVAW